MIKKTINNIPAFFNEKNAIGKIVYKLNIPELYDNFYFYITKSKPKTNDYLTEEGINLNDFFDIEYADRNVNEEEIKLYIIHEIFGSKILFSIENKKDLEDFLDYFTGKIYIIGRQLNDYTYSYIVNEYGLDNTVGYNDFVEFINSKFQ